MADTITVKYSFGNASQVFDYLREHGFSTERDGPDAVVIRECKDRSRLPLVHSSGIDRDKDSKFGEGGLVMKAMGIKPEDIIYAQKLRGELFYETCQFIPGNFYLLYDPKKIKRVVNEGRVVPGHGWQAREGHTFLDALILIILAERK